jgi:hypothetical protein
MTELIASKAISKWRRLGFLLEPLGWVQARLIKAIETEPTLVDLLFDLDQPRMHLMALALAHLASDVTPDLALVLLQGSRKTVLNLSVGHRPAGIDRVLRHVPPKVLPAESYRKLIDLLNDPVPAKFLHHTRSITEPLITGLHRLPAGLRTAAIMLMFARIEGMDTFVDSLRFLVSRTGLPLDPLIIEIGALHQPGQVAARIRHLVEALPLPNLDLPVTIGEFRPVDSVAEIRTLAKTWRNCLADYLYDLNEGKAAVYLSEDRQAVCLVNRYGRMGWFLAQVRGPKNVAIEPVPLAQIRNAFAAARIPDVSSIEAIKGILITHEWSRRRRPEDQEEIFDDIALY